MILKLEGHQNRITVSRVTAILLNGWILPIGQSGEASRWRVCYKRGLLRLVYMYGVPLFESRTYYFL